MGGCNKIPDRVAYATEVGFLGALEAGGPKSVSGGSAAFPRDPPAPPADCTLPAVGLRPPRPHPVSSFAHEDTDQSASRSRPHALTHLLTALKVLSQLRALWGRECPRRNSGGGRAQFCPRAHGPKLFRVLGLGEELPAGSQSELALETLPPLLVSAQRGSKETKP